MCTIAYSPHCHHHWFSNFAVYCGSKKGKLHSISCTCNHKWEAMTVVALLSHVQLHFAIDKIHYVYCGYNLRCGNILPTASPTVTLHLSQLRELSSNVKKTFTYPVYCSCHIPADRKGMVQCFLCSESGGVGHGLAHVRAYWVVT